MDRETSGEPESGSASSATDAVCPDCPQSWPAQCSVNYDSRNITCSVDLSSCRPFIPCDQNELCFAHFYRMSDTNWTFSGVCFPKEEGHKRKENCELRSRSDLPFPPRSGLECLCTKCSNLDQEVTYIDPFPPKPLNPEETSSSVAGSSLPATVKSSLVTPSPSPNTRGEIFARLRAREPCLAESMCQWSTCSELCMSGNVLSLANCPLWTRH